MDSLSFFNYIRPQFTCEILIMIPDWTPHPTWWHTVSDSFFDYLDSSKEEVFFYCKKKEFNVSCFIFKQSIKTLKIEAGFTQRIWIQKWLLISDCNVNASVHLTSVYCWYVILTLLYKGLSKDGKQLSVIQGQHPLHYQAVAYMMVRTSYMWIDKDCIRTKGIKELL